MTDTEGDRPAVTDLTAAAATGDRKKALVALRDRLAFELGVAEGAAVASLAREFTRVVDTLEQLGVQAEVTPLDRLAARVDDQLAARRSRRSAAAAGS